MRRKKTVPKWKGQSENRESTKKRKKEVDLEEVEETKRTREELKRDRRKVKKNKQTDKDYRLYDGSLEQKV